MQVRVLGPVEVVRNRRTITIDAAKPRALLAVLALHEGRPVATSELIDALWGEEAPPTAPKILQGYVSSLRRTLGDDAVVTVPAGYALGAAPEDVDAVELEHAIDRGRAALGANRLREARECFRSAAALWRGTPLVDLADGPFRQGQQARLDELRLAALDGGIEADLSLGRHRELVPELELLVAHHPLREPLWGQLMVALYRSGRQADALRTYQRLRELLAEELGVEPTPALAALEDRILRDDPTLDLAQPWPATNLPVPLDTFVGRELEIAQVMELLDEHRLVTLVGPGGVGKSRLALEVARRRCRPPVDGVWWVDLTQVGSGSGIGAEALTALGLDPVPGSPAEEVVGLALASRSVLLVLDNCEHLVADVAQFVLRLIGAAPGLRVLATSRAPLAVAGEWRWPVPPLGLPDGDGDVASSEAVQLFRERAAQRGGERDEDLPVVADICRRLDGLPLAIELAAAQLALLAPSELAERLRERGAVLDLTDRGGIERHGTLRAVLDASCAVLDEPASAVFAALAVFPGDFDRTAFEEVASAVVPSLTGAGAESVLATLVDASLVSLVPEGSGARRFRLLWPVREYATELLGTGPRHRAAEAAHARHYRRLAERVADALEAPDETRWRLELHRDQHNVRAALAWHERSGDAVGALAFAPALGTVVVLDDNVETRDTITRLLDAAPGAPVGLRAWALSALVWPQFLSGDLDGAVADGEATVALFERADDARGLARALRDVAHMILLGTGEFDRALPWYHRAIEVAGDAGLLHERARCQIMLGQNLALGDRGGPEVDAMLDEAEAEVAPQHDHVSLAQLEMVRMMLAYGRGDVDGTERHAAEELRLARLGGSAYFEQIALVALGVAADERGDADAAAAWLRQAVHLAHDTGNAVQLGIALQGVAAVRAAARPEEAARLWGVGVRFAPLWPVFARRYSPLLHRARRALGDEFERLVGEGAQLTPRQAVEVADTVC